MKKFALAISLMLLSSTASAKWSQADKDRFSELLWIPEQAETVSDKINLVNFISCLTDYYESKYTFEQVIDWWYNPHTVELTQEFIVVNDECKRMIIEQLNSTDV